MEKYKSVSLTLSQSMSGDDTEWNLKPKPVTIPNINQIQYRSWMIWDHKTLQKTEMKVSKSVTSRSQACVKML